MREHNYDVTEQAADVIDRIIEKVEVGTNVMLRIGQQLRNKIIRKLLANDKTRVPAALSDRGRRFEITTEYVRIYNDCTMFLNAYNYIIIRLKTFGDNLMNYEVSLH